MIFSSNFFPCIDYFRNIISEETIYINTEEQYKKQSYMTRAYVLGPHQVEVLNVPIKKYANHEIIKNIQIDYSTTWARNSWKTIQNSYKNSPYFLYFEDYIYKLFSKEYKFLIDLNHESLTCCLKLLEISKTICHCEFSYFEYKSQFCTFNAKNRTENAQLRPFESYLQNFGNKFESNLSVLDLIFQKGRAGKDFLN